MSKERPFRRKSGGCCFCDFSTCYSGKIRGGNNTCWPRLLGGLHILPGGRRFYRPTAVFFVPFRHSIQQIFQSDNKYLILLFGSFGLHVTSIDSSIPPPRTD